MELQRLTAGLHRAESMLGCITKITSLECHSVHVEGCSTVLGANSHEHVKYKGIRFLNIFLIFVGVAMQGTITHTSKSSDTAWKILLHKYVTELSHSHGSCTHYCHQRAGKSRRRFSVIEINNWGLCFTLCITL